MSRIRSRDLPLHVRQRIREVGQDSTSPREPWQGEHWDSQEEKRYGEHLKWLQKEGKIRDLDRQVRVDLHVGRRYMKLDFYYFDERLAEWVWDDYKALGWKKNRWYKDWKLKADMWGAGLGPGLLRISTPSQGGYHHEEIRPKPNPEALARMVRNAHATMNPQEFGEILAGLPAEAWEWWTLAKGEDKEDGDTTTSG